MAGGGPAAAMEPKHKELLAQCRQSLAQAMTEVDKVVELLEAAGALGPRDLRDLEAAGGGKAELLIALLLGKERDHFQDLRVALEKTQPHLLSILYLNGVAGPPAAAETAGEWGRGRGAGAGGGQRLPPPTPAGSAGPTGPPPRAGRERAGVLLFRARMKLSRVCSWALDACFVLPSLSLFLLAGAVVPVPERCRGCCALPFGAASLAWFPEVRCRLGVGKSEPEGAFLP